MHILNRINNKKRGMNISKIKGHRKRINTLDEICTDNCFLNLLVMLGQGCVWIHKLKKGGVFSPLMKTIMWNILFQVKSNV